MYDKSFITRNLLTSWCRNDVTRVQQSPSLYRSTYLHRTSFPSLALTNDYTIMIYVHSTFLTIQQLVVHRLTKILLHASSTFRYGTSSYVVRARYKSNSFLTRTPEALSYRRLWERRVDEDRITCYHRSLFSSDSVVKQGHLSSPVRCQSPSEDKSSYEDDTWSTSMDSKRLSSHVSFNFRPQVFEHLIDILCHFLEVRDTFLNRARLTYKQLEERA